MITGYAQPNKGRSRDILRRFAKGFGGAVDFDAPAKLQDGGAAFFGVVGIEHLLNEARTSARDWYYLDNSFFDVTRKTMIRIGHNRLQHDGIGKPDWQRFKALGIEVKPWKKDGRHIVVCPQSDHFMREVCGIKGGANSWLAETLVTIRANSDRPIIVREWSRDKTTIKQTLQADLQDAWALVTHMSAAANEALLEGVPTFVTTFEGAAFYKSSALGDINSPLYPDGREEWAATLAGQQWTLEEIENGTAKEMLCGMDG